MADNLGSGVSRVLDPKQSSFSMVVFQQGKPPLDSEFNLLQALESEWRTQLVLRGTPSGWLGAESNSTEDFITNPNWSNFFQFGRQRSGEKKAIQWAVVNGWFVPVTGTLTGTPPGSPDDTDSYNKITLDPPPANSGDFRSDFVFLEVWLARVAPNPSSTNKPSSSAIYRYGNVEGGYSYLTDSIQDPAIGFETTERVQLQYRIRVVKGLVGLATNPDGFDATVVKARGTAGSDTSFTFSNMRSTLGDPGLWRAGDGTTNTLGTVDGYSYAIPLSVVFRRNSVVWNGEPSPNLNGGFSRNPTAVDRTGVLTFSAAPTTASTISAAATVPFSVTLSTATGIPFPSAPANPVLIKIGDEFMSYSAISGTTMTISARAQNGSVAEAHVVGSTIALQALRPDGLFADQVAKTDILDVRHVVNPNGFDYNSLLRKNLDKLLRGQLRSNWKRSGAGPQGPFVGYQDTISASVAGSGVTKLDAPDNIRMIFSDAAVLQPVELIVTPTASPPTSTTPVQVSWGLSLTVYQPTQTTSSQFKAGDVLTVPVAQFKTSLPGSDADQFRFVHEVLVSSTTGVSNNSTTFTDSSVNFTTLGVSIGDNLVIYSGAAAGTYPVTVVGTNTITVTGTIGTANPVTYEIRQSTGSVRIRVDSDTATGLALPLHHYKVTRSSDSLSTSPGPLDDLKITLQPSFVTVTTGKNLYIKITVQYGAGRGLARRPDSIHNISVLSGGSSLLLPTTGIPASNVKIPTVWAPLWSKYQRLVQKGLLPTTAPSYADLGSKSIVLTPFRLISFPSSIYTLSGPEINLPTQGLMPLAKPDGSPKWTTTDPLHLFSGNVTYSGNNSNQSNLYVTLPRHLVPGFGAVYAPILPADTASYSQGINFMLQSKTGAVPDDPNQNKQYVNYVDGNISYAPFSTRNLSVNPSIVPATYNASFTFNGNLFAGMRFFTDSRGLGRKGLELPPFYGIARLFAVYEAQDYLDHGPAFSSTTRVPTGGGAKNLLKQSFDGPTFWIELDADGDSTFILNADVIDLTKSTVNPISSFETGNYVIESSIFGFDRGSFDLNGQFRLVLSSNRDVAHDAVANNIGVALAGPNTILPGPMPSGVQVLINYSRTPYMGDAFGSQTSYTDLPYAPGSLTTSSAYQLVSTQLNMSSLTRPNQKSLEVLASVGFMTTLGTGRFSGEIASSTFEFRNVGYEDPSAYPPGSGGAARPKVLVGALLSTEQGVPGDYMGCTERLPLGSLFRDKDFRGGFLSPYGNGYGTSAKIVFMNGDGLGGHSSTGLAATTTLEQTEVPIAEASLATGTPGDMIVHVDGETGNYSLLTNYRTLRGGSVFNAGGPHPGGEFSQCFPEVLGPQGARTNVLTGKAMLVRNTVTSVGSNEVSAGDELLMLIVTTVQRANVAGSTANEVTIGTNGSYEGYSAAEVYRIEGHPLMVDHDRFEVDPASITLAKKLNS